ncbi:MAG: 50S ribosomal protein L11 methyltransferase [Chromatiales bacterium]|jgi:ribosomal protein L11 methyltransferase
MSWLQAHLVVTKQQAELVELLFEQLGALSITFGDARDEPVLETLPDEIRLWPLVKITGLFDIATSPDAIRQGINQSLKQELSRQLELEILEDQPWERAWLEHFKPMRFGQHLWICPSGHQVDAEDAIVIELDPGLAFGTGTHPTTALCLEWLDAQDLHGKTLIDYGCGSGILAIAALKSGAAHATGIDYDKQALQASRVNAEKNRVDEQLDVFDSATQLHKQADIVMANILAGVLIELAPQLADLVKPNGDIVLSGILQEQADSVINAYRPYFEICDPVSTEGWVRLEGRRLEN